MILADTDVLIDYLGGQQPMADRIATELRSGLHTTAITRFELLSGAKGARSEERVRDLLGAIGTVPLDAESADQAAAIRGELESAGTPIGMADSLIAGIALRHRAVFLTRNVKHFGRVPGLFVSGNF